MGDFVELVILSGKGGTGKTSIAAALAACARRSVIADCDVDAPDLPIVLAGQTVETHVFRGSRKATILPEKCVGCGECARLCRFEAVLFDGPANDVIARTYRVDPAACEGCGVCARYCPAGAIILQEAVSGHWYVSRTRFGLLVHARLFPGESNSGRLVSLVRQRAAVLALETRSPWVLIDGPPGIGCPAISSLTDADAALIVAEPTLSGLHDAQRALEMAGRFGVKCFFTVNKHDLDADLTGRLQDMARQTGAVVLNHIPYDDAVTFAQMQASSVVEYADCPAGRAIEHLWEELRGHLSAGRSHAAGAGAARADRRAAR